MKKDIIFAGVGGQGIVSIASMLAEAVSKAGLHVKQNEVHGMSQRGGAVVCFVRISDKPIFSDTIPTGEADVILATEPMEALRYAEFLAKNGKIVTSAEPFKNIEYPDEQKIISAIKETVGAVVVDTKSIADELKNPRAGNIAMLGALLANLGIDNITGTIEEMIRKKFSKKGDSVVEGNLKALHMGMSAH